MIVISNSDHPHFLVGLHQGCNQVEGLGIHILSLVDYQDTLDDPALFHLPPADQGGGILHHIPHTLQAAQLTQQIKAIGMEGLDFYKISRIANEGLKTLLEFRGGSPGEGQHQQLLLLHILQKQEGGQLVNQNLGFSTAGSCGHHDIFGLGILDHLELALRKLSEKLLIFLRRDVAFHIPDPVCLEIFGDELLKIHLKVIPDKLQGRPVVPYHEIGILAYDVDLADLLLIELIQ